MLFRANQQTWHKIIWIKSKLIQNTRHSLQHVGVLQSYHSDWRETIWEFILISSIFIIAPTKHPNRIKFRLIPTSIGVSVSSYPATHHCIDDLQSLFYGQCLPDMFLHRIPFFGFKLLNINKRTLHVDVMLVNSN